MKFAKKWLLVPVVAAAIPGAAFAQSSDAAYCSALADKYTQYLDVSSRRGGQPQGVDAKVAIDRCKAGDMSGIPVLEKALTNAKIGLPPRT